jgi:hypothetical protein
VSISTAFISPIELLNKTLLSSIAIDIFFDDFIVLESRFYSQINEPSFKEKHLSMLLESMTNILSFSILTSDINGALL